MSDNLFLYAALLELNVLSTALDFSVIRDGKFASCYYIDLS